MSRGHGGKGQLLGQACKLDWTSWRACQVPCGQLSAAYWTTDRHGSSFPWSVSQIYSPSWSDKLRAHTPGVGIGISAALMSIMTVWLSDIKMGYCTTGWWLTQKFCCLEISDEGEGCTEWRNWGGVEPFRYFAYILFAVSWARRTARPS